MPCYSPLKGYKDRHTGGLTFRRSDALERMDVACGQCLGCRLDYSLMWAIRIAHEASMHADDCGNSFITLTYRDKRDCNLEQCENGWHIPDDWSLHPSHFTLFMKRLRKKFPQKIRYFVAGEYGRNCKHGINVEEVGCPVCYVGRPHFHACLFNCSFSDLESYASDDGVLRYTSKLLSETWRYGFVDVSELNFASAAYVARYVLKKVNGDKADWHYLSYDMEGQLTYLHPEFCRMSRGGRAGKGKRCGIGATWLEKYWRDVYPSDEVPVVGEGVLMKVPRYYDEMFGERFPQVLEEVKNVRKVFKMQHPDLFDPDRLIDAYKVKKAFLANKKRRL